MNTPAAPQTGLIPTPSIGERRERERLRLQLPLHIKHMLPLTAEDVVHTIDFNRNGACFISLAHRYETGTVVIVTLPYSPEATTRIKCLGEVVRIERLPSGAQAVALKFLS
jgi:hypothetical protein